MPKYRWNGPWRSNETGCRSRWRVLLTFPAAVIGYLPMQDAAFQKCINRACGATYGVEEVKVACTRCGSLLDIEYDWDKVPRPRSLNFFESRWATKGTETAGRNDFSGVW